MPQRIAEDKSNMMKIRNGRNVILKISRHDIDVSKPSQPKKPLHNHDMLEICWFSRGEGVYEIDGKPYSVHPDDIFLIYSGENHNIVSVSEQLEFVDIWFNIKEIMSGNRKTADELYENLKKSREKHKHIINEGSQHFCELKQLLIKIVHEVENRENGYISMVMTQINQLLILFMRELDIRINDEKSYSDAKTLAVEKAVIYILDHLADDFTLEEHAKRACLSPKYFGAVFKQVMGVTPWEYISEKKTLLACELLRTSKKGVLTIAQECGFNTAANFNKTFKKHMDMTPSEYRKNQKS